MSVIDLNLSFYCLYSKDHKGDERMFLQQDISPGSTRSRLDLFENKETLYRWIKEEQEIQALSERWRIHEIYDRLFPKKMFITEFSELMKEKEEIDSITVVDKIRRNQVPNNNRPYHFSVSFLDAETEYVRLFLAGEEIKVKKLELEEKEDD